MADMRKVLGLAYGSGPGRGPSGLHQLFSRAERVPGVGGGGSEQWMTDAQLQQFLGDYKKQVQKLTRNLTGYAIDDMNVPLVSELSAAEKLSVQDMYMNIVQRNLDINYNCADALAEDGWGYACGEGSTGDFASNTLGSTWKKPSMVWNRGRVHNGAPDRYFECIRCDVAFALSGTGDIYFNWSFPHQFDALDNQGPPWSGYTVGHSCLGLDEADIWLIPMPDLPTWFLKIFNADLSLVAPLANIGTKIGDAIDVTAYHDGDATADPQIAPNNWTNYTINVPSIQVGERYVCVVEARSKRWAWNGGDPNPSPTVPAFATMYGITNVFNIS